MTAETGGTKEEAAQNMQLSLEVEVEVGKEGEREGNPMSLGATGLLTK